MKRIPRRSNLRSDSRPFWRATDPRMELVYLGWGVRDYARYPSTMGRRDRWSYNLILRGSLFILLSDGLHRLSGGDAVVFSMHGSYSFGFKAEPGQLCEVLIWTWRTPPLFPEVKPMLSRHHICHMDREACQRLTALHSIYRREAARHDSFTERLLRGLRVVLETEFARTIQSRKTETMGRARIEEADRWLRAHLDRDNAIFDLCDFLQVSHSTLGRMFRAAYGETARAHLYRLRMEEAARLLASGKLSVKQVGYGLGYKHPNDFSRAFASFRRKTRAGIRKPNKAIA